MDARRKRTLYLIAIAALIVAMAVATYFLMPWMIRIATVRSARVAFLESIRMSGPSGVLALGGLVFLQVVIPVLPAEALIVGAGYLYGAIGGVLLCLTALTAGTMLNHLVGRYLGAGALQAFVKPDRLDRFSALVKGKRADTVVFLLYFIPGIPKDFVAYAAGISRYPFLRFLVVSVLARLPSTFGSVYIGASLASGHAGRALLVFLALAAVAVPAFLLSERILNWIQQRKERHPTDQEEHP